MTKLPAKSPAALVDKVLTAQQEAFASHYATFGDPASAYRHAYNVTTSRKASVQQMAYRCLHHPAIAARIVALRNQAAAADTASRESLVRDLESMTNVDVNELVQVVVGNCRRCHGVGHGYRWRTPEELCRALDDALTSKGAKPIPSGAGGFGFRADDPPADDCPYCDGAGVSAVRVTSTADLSLPARRMFKGVECYPDGAIKKILLHDAAQLRIELHKLKGMHVDRSVAITANVTPALKEMSRDEQLQFLESLRPAQ